MLSFRGGMLRLLLLVGVSTTLQGCLTRGGSSCPPIKPYTVAEQKAAAAEIRAGRSPTLNKFVADYGVTREQLRACASIR